MGTSATIGLNIDDAIRKRIEIAAKETNQTISQIIQKAILSYLYALETKTSLSEMSFNTNIVSNNMEYKEKKYQPFFELSEQILYKSSIRSMITASWRSPERTLVPILLKEASLSDDINRKIYHLSYKLTNKIRKHQKNIIKNTSIVQNLLQTFSLSSHEGISLMCLAEALLRIPDQQTQYLLIKDKIINGHWISKINRHSSLITKTAIYGLAFINRMLLINNNKNTSKSIFYIKKLIHKVNESSIRNITKCAIYFIGKEFVIGETINKALENSRKLEKQGFRYSYDMLGESALTNNDAKKYFLSYQQAIHAIGKKSKNLGIYEGPGISIKLSALHPRYNRLQYTRVMNELYPNLKTLVLLARSYDIGINIDAEESERLELSLDLLEKLCFEPTLQGWNGIGFVIQAYMKRCFFVIDELINLAQISNHRLMIRLVKGAYWDSEIKHAQIEGFQDYPVYTRKVYTDISYIACARKLLSVPNLIYPQFATHNAHTMSAIYYLAGNNYYSGQYEFQCLYGMGEILYTNVVGSISRKKLNRPCRIYAPVGTYKTLLAYLVRRLLENGANTSFVNKIANMSIPIDELISDPISIIKNINLNEGQIGLPHPKIQLPSDLYLKFRKNSFGIDILSEYYLTLLTRNLLINAHIKYVAQPIVHGLTLKHIKSKSVINPAIPCDIIGEVYEATEEHVSQALDAAYNMSANWFAVLPKERAKFLENAANIIESKMYQFINLLIREAGKTYNNAISEIRETIDFLYYYASIVKNNFHNDTYKPLGIVVCISPWNFPSSIFTGQIAAALVTGNVVLAKPSEQTPLIAAQIIKILIEAGIPIGVLQFLPGVGEIVGTQLISDPRISGVLFTGSLKVAKLIHKNISNRLDKTGHPISLIAETGGINAMIVDSSALTEQVVVDVISSAFDSAGQRCSALRVLCLQEDIAEYTLKMLRGAMKECKIGNPELLSTDIGPIIDFSSAENIRQYIQNMHNKGFKIYQACSDSSENNTQHLKNNFIKPTLIEIDKITDLTEEIFGPVLHIIRFTHNNLLSLVEQINKLKYGLTLGLHTRIEETVSKVISQAKIGNIYINRNIIGAVVGVQPFGGENLSGTGPKAGGPFYLYRLLRYRPNDAISLTFNSQNIEYLPNNQFRKHLLKPLYALNKWIKNKHDIASLCIHYDTLSEVGKSYNLISPTGEKNILSILPRNKILCLSDYENDILIQLIAAMSVGSKIIWKNDTIHNNLFNKLPNLVKEQILLSENPFLEYFDLVIYHGNTEQLHWICKKISLKPGPIISVHGYLSGDTNIFLERLLIERSVSINTTAVGGNTSLVTI
ncbi:MAG: trifunctional transcriptional regulator/proline dehydrogenase/L-glutamate gamma-semialdehyde dehydrogenase [Pantoea sp. Brub]|nr:trifunctional transcriptional regulator/proline dehydrogenase/L-glutamate gamma-semialdehyde dehydrogenase [Pantoea sp. Brub]